MSGSGFWFIIDEARCTGCQACAVACRDRAGGSGSVPWLRVEVLEGGAYPAPTLRFRVVHCYHCDDPACQEACAAGAIASDQHGLVEIDIEACLGCGACAQACPFGVVALSETAKACKCDGCADELAAGWEPTCVRACPMRALQYTSADGAIPAGRMVDATFETHGHKPRVRYLIRARSPKD